jgi:plastocyanin
VVAPGFKFSPASLHVQAGGTMNWTFGSTPHDVTFTTGGALAGISQLQDGSAARTFPANGSFNYRCTIHSQITGSVHVH